MQPEVFLILPERYFLRWAFPTYASVVELICVSWLQIVQKLHLILRPFLLRRLKEDVEKALPRKKEVILYANMSDNQKAFHDHLIKKTLVEYFEATRTSSG